MWVLGKMYNPLPCSRIFNRIILYSWRLFILYTFMYTYALKFNQSVPTSRYRVISLHLGCNNGISSTLHLLLVDVQCYLLFIYIYIVVKSGINNTIERLRMRLYKFVSMLHSSQFVSIAGVLFSSHKLKYTYE